ncbi:MAG TPA: response regulator [Burkholderiales bacterium]|nr:response regulator [Burkholderiales bacterium]
MSRFRVLVVDDDPDMIGLLTAMIAAEGMAADAVSDGDAALVHAMASPPGLILLDVILPGMDGFALCERLKREPATAMVPIVLVTGLDDRESRVRGIRAGADDFLSKPVRREELVARVQTLRRLHEVRRELEAGRLAAEVARKEALRKAFQRYISPRLAERIIADLEHDGTPFERHAQRTGVVALFADLRGFTRLAEATQVADVVGFLNEYFAVLTEAAYRHEGTIFNMAGDSLLVGFNVPFPQPDAAKLACRAAQDMAGSVKPLLERWSAGGGTPTGVGFGMAAGDAIIGNIGSPHYMNYTIIGDAVNVAARLVEMARPGELLLSRAALHAAGDCAAGAEPRGPLALRGRREPVEAYAVKL